MFVLCNLCARAELHQQKRARKLCSATLKLGMIIDLVNKLCMRLGIYYDNNLNHARDMKGSSLIHHNSTIQFNARFTVIVVELSK